MIAAPATAGPWVDTATPCNVHVAAALRAAGKVGIVRYVPLPANGSAADISAAELGGLVGEGLDCMLVQHVRRPPWDPGAHDGEADGAAAAAHAERVGYPPGCHLWLDVEGITGSATATVAFAVAWQRAVIAAGYRSGLYVGYAVPLDAEGLYELPGFDSYWSDFGRRSVATRGFAVVQHAPEVTIGGVSFDRDDVAPDALGDLPMACRSDQA